jgi:DNA-binding MarR family transcriptional regulator
MDKNQSKLKKGSKPADLEQFESANRTFFRLYQTTNLLHKVGTRAVSEFGSTTQQWAVMGALARSADIDRGMTVKDLMTFLMVSRQTITPLLDRLKERGWIESIKSQQDARNRHIRLTPLGRDLWARMLIPIADFYSEALAEFSPSERAKLYELLNKLKIGMSKM